MIASEIREELLKLVKEKAVRKGEHTLSSGKKSSYYIDGKQVTLDPHGILLIGKAILSMLQGSQVDAVGGPTLGADPIAAAVSLLSFQTGKPLKAFIVRKEEKKHGTQKRIEGPSLEVGDKVAVVEDVITSGKSVMDAIQEIEKLKCRVVKVICLVDREEGAKELLEPYNFSPIFTRSELGLNA
ncbi:MAG: orotate phosphoribosyltransferase [Candidatus Omnitrophica bacterium]|nr:orotate phosphoribosyltransferase [Candidatus Omnitrophota bacterium]